MKNKRAMAAALAAVLYLTGCAYVTGDTGKTAPKNTTEAETSQSAEETEAAPRMEESVEDAVFSEEEEDEEEGEAEVTLCHLPGADLPCSSASPPPWERPHGVSNPITSTP